MPGIHVVTDSASDMTRSMAEDRGVRVVPLTIRFGDEELVDRTELSTADFWKRLGEGTVMPSTAAPAPGAFQEAFTQAADAGAEAVVCICLSSELSATYQSACTAASALSDRIEVRVIDSLSVTAAQGMLVQAAVDAAEAGRSLDEIEAEVLSRRDRTRIFAVIDSLEFLRRGGRIGGAAALLGSMLSIKPVIEVREGRVDTESKQRTRSRALAYLATKAVEAGPGGRVTVVDGDADDVQDLLDLLAKSDPPVSPEVVPLGPVIGSHTGPGTIGMCYQAAAGQAPPGT